MNKKKPDMIVPALIGGAVAGVLSALPVFSCLCCIWIIGGAVLAAYLFTKDSPVILTAGDGAILGVLTGVVAAVVEAIVSIPLEVLNKEFVQKIMERFAEYTEEIPPGLETLFESGGSIFMFFAGLIISAAVFAAFGALGGIIGISLFGKKAVQKTPGDSNVPKNASNR